MARQRHQTLAFLAFLFASVVPVASAQEDEYEDVELPPEDEDCSSYEPGISNCSLNRHAMVGGPPFIGPNKYVHTGCKSCVRFEVYLLYTDTIQLSRDSCHPPCDMLMNNEQYAMAFKAAGVGDVARLIELAKSVPNRIAFNSERESIQILDCRGESVVMNVQLDPEQIRQAKLALPSVQVAMAANSERSNPAKNLGLLAIGVVGFVGLVRMRIRAA